jgi:hypothetical protein
MERLEIDLMAKLVEQTKLCERSTKFITYQVNIFSNYIDIILIFVWLRY